MNPLERIYDWEGELKQRLPSGELHVNGDLIAISSNSNDQVVVYSLSEVLELPIFNIGGAVENIVQNVKAIFKSFKIIKQVE